MSTLKKLFIYLMIVLFISIFFQSVAILFIKYSRDGNQFALERSFRNGYMATSAANGEAGKPADDRGGAKLLNTLASVIDNIEKPSQQAGNTQDKIVVPVKRNSSIDEFKPEQQPEQKRQVTAYVNGKNEVVEIPYGHKIIFHTLSYGERLSDVAKLYGTKLDSIKSINGFKENYRIYVGQKIMVVQSGENAPAASVAAVPSQPAPQVAQATKAPVAAQPAAAAEQARTQNSEARIASTAASKALDDDITSIIRSSKNAKSINREAVPVSTSKDPLADIIKSAKKKRRVFKWPLRGEVSSKFGMRLHPVYGDSAFHTGIDIAAGRGRPVMPAMGGKVVFAGWLGGYGKMIEIRHPKGYTTKYAHLSKIKVRQGQEVTSASVIGNVGDTGTSTGYHLHFEVRKNSKPLNPLAFIQN